MILSLNISCKVTLYMLDVMKERLTLVTLKKNQKPDIVYKSYNSIWTKLKVSYQIFDKLIFILYLLYRICLGAPKNIRRKQLQYMVQKDSFYLTKLYILRLFLNDIKNILLLKLFIYIS